MIRTQQQPQIAQASSIINAMTDEPEVPSTDDVVSDVAEKARSEMAHTTEELEEKLKQFEAKSADVRGKYENKKLEQKRILKSEGQAARGLGNGLMIAYTILGFPMLGFGGGWLIDRYAVGRGNGWQTWLGLLGFFVGVGMAMFMLNRMSSSDAK